ncbi:putative membrane protein [Halapricum desulfuricans]|uniref:Putative membrane protein n=2 Tax=Halapricum desulfuricans TaxID=2841257 RepID=A0A897N1G1_9EURY|nr:putative membrane protein [Halapricum desulfuricans]
MMADLVGLNELANDPNLTFIAFIAFFLLAVLGVRFALYAYWNGRAGDDTQTTLWGYLLLVGVVATGYGLVGIGRIVLFADWLLEVASGTALLFALVLALALREIDAASAGGEPRSGVGASLTVLFLGAVGLVTVALVALPAYRQSIAGLVGAGGLLFLSYGYRFGQRQLDRTRVRGTLLETLLRHLLPVLLFAALIPIAELAVFAGLDRVIVLHVQVVLVIMTATTLMTSTIKLRQNLRGMRA